MSLSPERRKLRARKAAIRRHHPGADTAELDREMAAAGLAEHIRRVVDGLPPLTAAQRLHLAGLLTSGEKVQEPNEPANAERSAA